MEAFLQQRDLLTGSLMGFISGYTTSNTKVRFNTFGGMMTGNTVKLGITLAQGEYAWSGVFAACVANFFLGTIAALFMIQKLGARRAKLAFLGLLCMCFALVDGVALAVDNTPEEYNIWASLVSSVASFARASAGLDPSTCEFLSPVPCPAPVSLAEPKVDGPTFFSAVGAQNLLSQKAGLIKANTTFMTGNIQKMAEALWIAYQKRKSGGLKPSESRAALLLFYVWLFYVVGGVAGASTAGILGFHWSLTPVAILYALGMASMLTDPPKKGDKKTAPPNPQAVAPAAEPVTTVPIGQVDMHLQPTPAAATVVQVARG